MLIRSTERRPQQGTVVWQSLGTRKHKTARARSLRSSDGGATFSKPIRISTGNSFGHTSVALDENGNAIVSWLEEGSGDGVRLLARQVTSAGAAGPVVEV